MPRLHTLRIDKEPTDAPLLNQRENKMLL